MYLIVFHRNHTDEHGRSDIHDLSNRLDELRGWLTDDDIGYPEFYNYVATVDVRKLEQAYKATNHINRNWKENPEVVDAVSGECRSTSVGDVIFDTSLNARYVVDRVGFIELRNEAHIIFCGICENKIEIDDESVLVSGTLGNQHLVDVSIHPNCALYMPDTLKITRVVVSERDRHLYAVDQKSFCSKCLRRFEGNEIAAFNDVGESFCIRCAAVTPAINTVNVELAKWHNVTSLEH